MARGQSVDCRADFVVVGDTNAHPQDLFASKNVRVVQLLTLLYQLPFIRVTSYFKD